MRLKHLPIVLAVTCLTVAGVSPAAPLAFEQVNLVSNGAAVANFTDANLVNPWGLTQAPNGTFWVSNQGSGVATLYSYTGSPQPLVVTVPAVRPEPSGPTGIVANGTPDFVISEGANSAPAQFIFVGLDGSISGWSPDVNPTNAIIALNDSDRALFTGVTPAQRSGQNVLYVANGLAGAVDVYGPDFLPVSVPGSFEDPNVPFELEPFNVAHINDKLYVTYAIPGPVAIDETEGSGAISVFDLDGNYLQTLVQEGPLASPWAMTLAPEDFGDFGGALLVGNFNRDGYINAFDPDTGEHLGRMLDESGQPIGNEGLWTLIFGNGQGLSDVNTLYFTAGINGEQDGLFGAIRATGATAIPLPNMLLVSPLLFALAGLASKRIKLW